VIYFTDPQSGVIRRIAGDRCDDVLIADLFGFGYPEENGVQLPHSVIKRMSKGRNDMNLLDYNQFVKTLRDSLDGGMLIQKYIKARGNHPSLYRTTWKRHGASTGVLITGLKSTSMAPKVIDSRKQSSEAGFGFWHLHQAEQQQLAGSCLRTLAILCEPCTEPKPTTSRP